MEKYFIKKYWEEDNEMYYFHIENGYVEREIINYYSSNYDFDVVDEYLMVVDGMNLLTKSRIKLIELMIMRGMYERAYEFMAKYGYSIIDSARVLRCGSKLIESKEFIKDELQ